MIIDASHFLKRVGTDAELPKDRKHCATLLRWQHRYNWRKAKADGDYERMERLERDWAMIECL